MTAYRLKGTSGELINQSFKLDGRLVVGRADDCDVRVGSEGVAAHHAEIEVVEQGKVRLRDLGSGSGTRVNGVAVNEAMLFTGDEIQVDRCRLMLQAPGLRPEKVLTEEATRPASANWRWLLPVALALMGVLAWQRGWLEPLMAMLQG